jgi:hypothetical protein
MLPDSASNLCHRPPQPQSGFPSNETYGFLPIPLSYTALDYGDVDVTSDLAQISPASDETYVCTWLEWLFSWWCSSAHRRAQAANFAHYSIKGAP